MKYMLTQGGNPLPLTGAPTCTQEEESTSSDDDEPLSKRMKGKSTMSRKKPKHVAKVKHPHYNFSMSVCTTLPSTQVPAGASEVSSDSDDDIPLSHRNRALAKKWVEKNKINKSLDKTQDAYVSRVLNLLASGTGDRAALMTRRATAKGGSKTGLDPVLIATEARVYYSKEMKKNEKRPKKVLDHKMWPTLGVWYLCLWSDVGYAGQDVEEWKPADYAMQFEGLVETYRQVFIAIICIISLFICHTYELSPP